MRLLHFLLGSRGGKNLALRALTLFQRFGFTPKKMEKAIDCAMNVAQKLGVRLSFPVTAVIVERYPEIIKRLQDKGVEFAVHGYIHTDYSALSKDQQLNHLQDAVRIFKSNGISFNGFRAPYTLWNEDTMFAIKELKILWDSSKTVIWDVFNPEIQSVSCGLKSEIKKSHLEAYKKALNLYDPMNASDCLVLPELDESFVEIPLCLPDDEMMVDRLGLRQEKIIEIWERILDVTYEFGEVFTLQLHPERFCLCGGAVESVIRRAKRYRPKVWIATLCEIAEWWIEKSKFGAEIRQMGNGSYRLSFNCSSRATILLRDVKVRLPIERSYNESVGEPAPTIEKWYNSYQRVVWAHPEFVLEDTPLQINSEVRPVIGIGTNCSPELITFLKEEGYILEIGKKKEYAFYFDGIEKFNKFEVLGQIENSGSPLIRFWRWPYGARSCLSITGDIDALTLFDFFMRVFGK